jgi:uncharacterized membrane protein
MGKRIASALKARGIPDEAVVFAVSALPVVELRAGVPIGFMLGLSPARVFLLAVAGNMVPVFVILSVLRLKPITMLFGPFLARARHKAAPLAASASLPIALLGFIAIPLPGTGAVTGSLIAYVLNMPLREALLSITGGVLGAASIMTVLSAMGRAGAAIALIALLALCVSTIISNARRSAATASNVDLSSSGQHQQLMRDLKERDPVSGTF